MLFQDISKMLPGNIRATFLHHTACMFMTCEWLVRRNKVHKKTYVNLIKITVYRPQTAHHLTKNQRSKFRQWKYCARLRFAMHTSSSVSSLTAKNTLKKVCTPHRCAVFSLKHYRAGRTVREILTQKTCLHTIDESDLSFEGF